MAHPLQTMLQKYDLKTRENRDHAIREIAQELALLGLWRAKFFEHAAFCGGTCLRIFHGLRRFSEDLDFSLVKTDSSYDMRPYLKAISDELSSFGFVFSVEKKEKESKKSVVLSAFIKGNTVKNLLVLGLPEAIVRGYDPKQKISIKLEIDTNPPPYAVYETLTLLTPFPFQVRLFNKPCLFAGKLHAILCRPWAKGRDFYDFIWFIQNNVPCSLKHLKARMAQTGHLKTTASLTGEVLAKLLMKKFEETDWAGVKRDLLPFITDAKEISLWNERFFTGLVGQIQSV